MDQRIDDKPRSHPVKAKRPRRAPPVVRTELDTILRKIVVSLSPNKRPRRYYLGLSLAAQLGRSGLARAAADESPATRGLADRVNEALGADADPLLTLVRALADPNRVVRKSAGAALKALGRALPAAVTALIEALKDDDKQVRQAAARTLGRIGREAIGASGSLVRTLWDENAEVRAEAAQAIGRIARRFSEPAFASVPAEFEHPEWPPDAMTALERLLRLGRTVVPGLLPALQDKNPAVRAFVASAVGLLGVDSAEASEAIAAAVEDPDPDVCIQALGAFAMSSGQATVQILIKATYDKRPTVRAHAVRALGNCDTEASRVFPELRRALGDEDANVREQATAAFRQVAQGNGIVLQLVEASAGDRIENRVLAVRLLTLLGWQTSGIVQALTKTLQDDDPQLRQEAAAALRAGHPDAVMGVLPTLVKALGDDDLTVRAEVALAIGRGGHRAAAAVPALIESVTALPPHSWPQWRENAVLVFGQLGPAAAKAAPAVIGLLDGVPGRIRSLVIASLGRMGVGAVRVLAKALSNSAPAVRAGAAEALGWVDPGARNTVPMFAKALFDRDRNVGWEALIALLQASGDPEAKVRATAKRVLRSIGSQVVPELKKALQDNRPLVRESAELLLTQLTPKTAPAVPPPSPSVSDEDRRVLSWFAEVKDLGDYLTHLQVFWCIGQVDREAIQSANPAMGWRKLNARLGKFAPVFNFSSLPTGSDHLRNTCLPELDGLFDREPFYSKAWSDEERGLPLRMPWQRGKRPESRWTRKAWTAWRYVDRFLTLRDLLPQVEGE